MILEKEKTNDFVGFYNQGQERVINSPEVIGNIPEWLDGNLIRTTSAKFDFKGSSYNHWFDGLCMLYSFSFDKGKARYQSKFLQSDDYIKATQNDKVVYQAFGTNTKRNIITKLKDIITPQTNIKPNANVNITRINGDFVAMTEIPSYVKFNPENLDTLDLYNFQDDIKGQVTTAHPHFDFKTGEFYNMLINFSATSHYVFYKMKPNSSKREIIAQIPVKSPCYVHSFGLTENYIILAECPLMVNPLSLMFSDKPFIENYKWNPKQSSNFYIIEKSTGKYKKIETDAFFTFHTINAYELNNEIIFDLVAFNDSSVIDSFYMENLRKGDKIPQSRFRRYTIDLNKNTCKFDCMSDLSMELPRINYSKYNTKDYNYLYVNSMSKDSSFLNQISMINIHKNITNTWSEDDCYPGEPVFVPNPKATTENDGVILSTVLDNKNKESFLLIIDANNFEELARIKTGDIIPLGFHGQFFKS